MKRALDDAVWRASTALRDRLPAADARDLVLSLVALRALDDAPDRPEGARWSTLTSPARVAGAIEAWRAARPGLAAAWEAPPPVEAPRMREVRDAIDAIGTTLGADPLGELYMVLLGRFARAEGRRGGQFFTPPDVAALLAALVAPVRGAVYDPACGTGGLLLEAARIAEGRTAWFGQELNPATWRLAHLAAAIRGVPIALGDGPADTLHDDRHPSLRADIVLGNPPFNLAWWGPPPRRDDPRWALGAPPTTTANLAWLLHALHHLRPDGRGALVLANASCTERRSAERALRHRLLASGRVEAVIALPDRLFWTTSIPATVWVLGRARGDAVLLVDARDLGAPPTRGRRDLPPAHREEIVGLVRSFREGAAVPAGARARAVPIAALVAGEARLVPGDHVHLAPPTPEPHGDAPGIDTLRALSARARALDDAILADLERLEPRR